MLPLEGIKVLDFTVAIYGALATQMLGDLGAEVLKVERLDVEDPEMAHVYRSPGASWLCVNRSKKSLAVDLKQEEGKGIVLKLAREADVVADNFRVGVMDRMGLGYDQLSQLNPRIICASFYSFGETGPLAHRIGADRWAQAMGGVVSIQGSPGAPPYQSGVAIADQGGACIAAFGIVVALLARERTGQGQAINSSMINSIMHLQTAEISDYLIDGILNWKMGRGWRGGLDGPYGAKDKDVMMMMMGNWPAFCRVLGLEHIEHDPRFENDEKRRENREALYPFLDKAFKQKTAAEWQQIFRQERMRCDPCLDHRELLEHPQVEANEMVVTLEHPERGTLRMVAPPIKFKKTPAIPHVAPPLLGQHTEEVLLRLGYTRQEIESLVERRVVKTASLAHKA